MPVAGTCAIGRAPSNQLVLADDKISRHHALIRIDDRAFVMLVGMNRRHPGGQDDLLLGELARACSA